MKAFTQSIHENQSLAKKKEILKDLGAAVLLSLTSIESKTTEW